jgi:hypothetical protein
VFDFPAQQGNYEVTDPLSPNFTNVYKTRYNVLQYDIGLNYTIGGSPIFVYAGFGGDRQNGNSATVVSCAGIGPAPGSTCPPATAPTVFAHTHSGFYGGLGFKF